MRGIRSMRWVMGMNTASPRDGEWLALRCCPVRLPVPVRGGCPPDRTVAARWNSCPFPHQKKTLILVALIPRDEQSLPRRWLRFGPQHPAPTAVQIACFSAESHPAMVILGWRRGRRKLALSQALQRAPVGITSCVVGSAWVNSVPSASPLPAAKYLPAPLPVCKARVLSSG